MRTQWLPLFLIALFPGLSSALDIKQKTGELATLPKVYVDHDACPFECCRYGDWTALKPMPLVGEKYGSKPVAKLAKGDHVVGLGGDVDVQPLKIDVLKTSEDRFGNVFAKGDSFYVLTPLGEGMFTVWAKGLLFTTEIYLDSRYEIATTPNEQCEDRPDRCWFRQHGPLKTVWWVKVKTDAGVEGWIEEGAWKGQDGCG